MAKQNSVNLDITNNADGFDVSGGTTSRKLTVSGGDIAMTGSGSAVITFPSSTSTLATLDLSETFTNKTLTSPTLNTPSVGTSITLSNLGELRFAEATGNGTNYVGFEAPSNITSNLIWILPAADGTSNQVLSTNGSGTLSWATVSGSGITRSVNNISSTASAGATASTDYVYNVTSGTFTLTMPTAVSNTNRYTIKQSGTGILTIATTSSQTIDGSTTYTISKQYQAIDLISDGTNWIIV